MLINCPSLNQRAATEPIWVSRHDEDNVLRFKPGVRMKKGDLMTIFGARRAALIVSETVDLLGLLHTTNGLKKEKISSE